MKPVMNYNVLIIIVFIFIIIGFVLNIKQNNIKTQNQNQNNILQELVSNLLIANTSYNDYSTKSLADSNKYIIEEFVETITNDPTITSKPNPNIFNDFISKLLIVNKPMVSQPVPTKELSQTNTNIIQDFLNKLKLATPNPLPTSANTNTNTNTFLLQDFVNRLKASPPPTNTNPNNIFQNYLNQLAKPNQTQSSVLFPKTTNSGNLPVIINDRINNFIVGFLSETVDITKNSIGLGINLINKSVNSMVQIENMDNMINTPSSGEEATIDSYNSATTLEQNKKRWCYIGKFKDERTCAELSEVDTCTGIIFDDFDKCKSLGLYKNVDDELSYLSSETTKISRKQVI